MEKLLAPFMAVGTGAIKSVQEIGATLIFLGRAIAAGAKPPYRIGLTLQQAEFVGFGSLFIVVLTGTFTGAVFTLQTVNALSRVGMESMVGSTVVIAVARELSPVLTSLMVTGRVGSSMATELGTMRVSEQIDAMEVMAVDPLQYLIAPRLVAGAFMVPCLCLIFDMVAAIGSYLVAVVFLHIDEGSYIARIKWMLDPADFTHGLYKGIVFGIVITLVGCYKGYNATGGARRRRRRHHPNRGHWIHRHLRARLRSYVALAAQHAKLMIDLQDIRKRFGKQEVLKGVSFKVNKGTTRVILGLSGSGKSVLMKHIIGLLMPDSGSILVDGEDITKMDHKELLRVRRKFGMVFQQAALFDSMNVGDNVAFPLREHTKLNKSEVADKVAHMLKLVGLPDIQHKFPAELSGGMRKRVGLARAIVLEPTCVLYDEPTTGLDPITTDNVDNMIMEAKENLNVTSGGHLP